MKIRQDLREKEFSKRRNTNQVQNGSVKEEEVMNPMNPKSGKKLLIVDPNYA